MHLKAILSYPIALIKSIGKKNFTAMGKVVRKSADTIARMLPNANETRRKLECIAKYLFRDANKLYLLCDTSTIRKEFSNNVEGMSPQYDTKQNRVLTGLSLFAAMLSDGKTSLPLDGFFADKKGVTEDDRYTQQELVKYIIMHKNFFLA
jgi:hypothetical protein